MADNKRNITSLKDYLAPDFLIEKIDLHFDLGEEKTTVRSALRVCRNVMKGRHQRALIFQGEGLKLISLKLNEKILPPHRYQKDETSLTIFDVPELFTMEIITEIYPQKNTALSGLYLSGNMFCTQCEAQGFRKITYYFDRPDIMAPFTTTIVADKNRYPILLSNGNKIEQGELSDNRHWVKWQDPFKKPCYLFALVAGNLSLINDTFTTMNGRKVALEIFVEPENKDKCDHAMFALKKAMEWDEKTYGREYDLDIYMIVAANDFNMGAMENKGLNIFNSKYVLANEASATDIDFQNIEAVIGHEYFHNWTGNRVTCRDWFQLSLKEGLTVFREQQFSAAIGSPGVKRISDVRLIRTRQFSEDAGPMAHPVQPATYIEINNFYTSTIYYKGAEVIRMLHTLLGAAGFRKGMDLYFKRHDGQAVTISDFVGAMSDANDRDLTQFDRWYHQAGTPEIVAKGEYNEKTAKFTLHFSQSCPLTPDQKEKKPYLIPIKIALYDKQGQAVALTAKEGIYHTQEGDYLLLDKAQQEFVFDTTQEVVPSLLRNFSAPVKLAYPYTPADLVILMVHDNDAFNRWDATQQLSMQVIKSLMKNYAAKQALTVPDFFIEAFRQLLHQEISDPALFAQLLSLPSFDYIAQELAIIDIDAILAAKKVLVQAFCEGLQKELLKIYKAAQNSDKGSLDGLSMGYRALKNTCLFYLMKMPDKKYLTLAKAQYDGARNMTDSIGALNAVNHSENSLRQTLFEAFYEKWKHDPLVVNKWLSLHACSEIPTALDNIEALLSHEAFDIKNPNKVYALINAFSMNNPQAFHESKGRGYQFLAQRVIALDQKNPQVAARALEAFTQWKRLDKNHGELMKKSLIAIERSGHLSEDVYEIVTKSLVS